MKRRIPLLLITILFIVFVTFLFVKVATVSKHLIISSPQFASQGRIPKQFTCDGTNINPPLMIKNLSVDAKSLVLIVDDPDAPMGIWTHWLVWNIDPQLKEIQEGTVPKGAIVGKNDFGEFKYSGPCPPKGTHRYFFRLYALDIKLNLSEESERRIIENSMKDHILDTGELVGIYTR